jgi:drug/metabolite transporter (DMT)-like permease
MKGSTSMSAPTTVHTGSGAAPNAVRGDGTVTGRHRVPWQAKFLALSLIWGSSFLLMKLGLRALAPVQISAMRIFLGTAMVVSLLVATGGRLPRGAKVWGHLFVSGFFLTAFPFTMFALGETRVSSALAGIGNSITPIAMVVFSLLLIPAERITRDKLFAVGLGLVGVLVITEPWSAGGSTDLVGFGITLLGGASYGVGWPYIRRFLGKSDLGGLSQPAAVILCGSALMVPITLIWWWTQRDHLAAPWTVHAEAGSRTVWVAVLAIVVLGAVGTGVAYMLQFDVVRDAGAVVSSTVTYLIPVVSVVLGMLVLSESLAWPQLVGFAIVLAAALVVGRPAGGWSALRRSHSA